MSNQTAPVPFTPTDEQAKEIYGKLVAVAVEERPFASKVIDQERLDLTEEQIAWAVEAGYASRGWDDKLFLPKLTKVYAYQPGTPDESYRVDVALDPSFAPDGHLGSDAKLLRLGRAQVDHQGDKITVKAYSATDARDSDHDTARTAHLVIEGVGLRLFNRGCIEIVGFLTESKMYPTGHDTEVSVESDGSTYLCERCETPHPFTDQWLPPKNLVTPVVKVKVMLSPADLS